MLSDMWKKLQDFFKPYTLEDFIADNKPVDHKDVERLERLWQKWHDNRGMSY